MNVDDNTFEVAGDNDTQDGFQNIAVYFWQGTNEHYENNTFTFLGNGTEGSDGFAFGFQNGTTAGDGYDGLVISGNTFQLAAWATTEARPNTVSGITLTKTVHRISRSPATASWATATNFRSSVALELSSRLDQPPRLPATRSPTSTYAYVANDSAGNTSADRFTFTNNILSHVGGADGIFLQNVTTSGAHVGINWNIDNTIDGFTGVRGLNELSTQATGASRPNGAATDLSIVNGVGAVPIDYVSSGWSTATRFSDPDGIGAGVGPVAFGFNGFTSIQTGIDTVDSGGTVNVLTGTYNEDVDASTKTLTLEPGASTAQITINGNLTLGAHDTLPLDLDGTIAASQFDNFVVSGTITLGGATLDLTRGFDPVPGAAFTLLDNTGMGAISGTFAGYAEGAPITLNGIPFTLSYVGGPNHNSVVLSEAQPTVVYVDDNWIATDDASGGGPGVQIGDTVMSNVGSGDTAVSGLIFGYNAFSSINAAIAGVAASGTIHVLAGSYYENVVATKPVEITGQGQSNTTLYPSFSGPIGSGGGSISTGSSNIILVQANSVTIDNLTLDGINPNLGSAIDARNGIITNHTIPGAVFNGLDVHDTTVKNIYLRGIYASTGGTFDIEDNTVDNVQSDPSSIAIFNFGGAGTIAGNHVSNALDSISANHSTGTTFSGNFITLSATLAASGIHTDNMGDGGIGNDLIENNHISGGIAGSYGIFVFVPYLNVTVENNTIAGSYVGLAVFGGGAAAGTATFTGNTVSGGRFGLYVTTDQLGFGTGAVSAVLAGNSLSVSDPAGAGILVDATPLPTTTASIQLSTSSPNILSGGAVGLDLVGSGASLVGNTLGDTDFESTGTYVSLDSSAYGTTRTEINGTSATFGGIVAGSLDLNVSGNLASEYAIEDKISDSLDTGSTSLAFVRLKSADVFVTQLSDSIQRGVDAASSGDTLYVSAGTFAENVVVNKSLTLLGANSSIDPNTGIRGAETIVEPAAIETSAQGSTSGTIFRLGTNSGPIAVTIDGFTIDGSNASLNTGGHSGVTLNGVDIDTGAGIDNSIGSFDANPGGFDVTMTVTNNVIENLERYGVLIDNTAASTAVAGNLVSHNKIDNIPAGDNSGDSSGRGRGAAFEDGVYGTFSYNVVTRVDVGWQDDNYFLASPGAGTVVDHNTITTYDRGIFHNLQYEGATPITISNNTISVETSGDFPATSIGFGIELSSIQSAVGATLTDNNVTGNVYGILLWNTNTTGNVSISGGVLSGNQYGIDATSNDPFFGAAAASQSTISNVTIVNPTTAGIAIDNSASIAGVSLAIGSGVQILLSGAETGILVTGPSTSIAGNTLNNLVFATSGAYTGQYIDLTNHGLAGNTLDATGVLFGATFDPMDVVTGGTTAAALPLATQYALEDQIGDTIDNGSTSTGFVRLVAGQVFITPTSFTGSATTANPQTAINAASSGDIVNLEAGRYVADSTQNVGGLFIDRPLTFLGAQAGVDARSRTGAETVIVPNAVDPNPFHSTAVRVVYVNASNVTIDGVTVDGSNSSLVQTNSVTFHGVPIDAAEGIVSYTGVGNITIRNNIVKDTAYTGIDFDNQNDSGVPTSNNTITKNLIENLSDAYGYGIGVLVYDNFYAQVTQNKVSDALVGVQTGNFYLPNPSATFGAEISDNALSIYGKGIYFNLHYTGASPFQVDDNVITAATDGSAAPVATWGGIKIASQQTAVSATFQGNTIDGTGAVATTLTAGYIVWNTPTTGTLLISGGTVNHVQDGILEGDFVSGAGDNTNVTISGTLINASSIGIDVVADPADHPSDMTIPTVSATILTGTTITVAPGGTGILVSGVSASALITGATISGGLYGIDVNGGAATISGGNIFGSGTGIFFTNGGSGSVTGVNFVGTTSNVTDLSLAANAGAVTLGLGDAFAAGTTFIDNGSSQGLDATGDTFDVGPSLAQVGGDNLTLAEAYSVEDGVLDLLDAPARGYVKIKNGNVFVTQKSETTTAGAIQRGINVSGTGDMVHVQAGNFAGGISIGHSLKLLGAGSSSATGSIVTSASGNVVTIAADNVTVDGLRIVGNGTTNSNGSTDGIFFDSAVAGATLSNLVSTGHSVALEIHNSALLTGLVLDQVSLLGSGVGLRVGTSGKVNGLTVTGSHFDNDQYGFYTTADSSVTNNQASFTNVNVSTSTFSNDDYKGIYVEKLDNATFNSITVAGSGFGTLSPNGININLKFGSYSGGITISNSTVTSSGTGTAGGAGVAIAARNDAPSYSSNAAVLSNLALTNLAISGSPTDLSLENNITGVSLSGVSLGGTGAGLLVSGSPQGNPASFNLGDTSFDGSLAAYIIDAAATTTITATAATFGGVTAGAMLSVANAFPIAAKIADSVAVSTFGKVILRTGEVYVTPHSFFVPGGTSTPKIQRGVDTANIGDTVNVQAGSYSDDVTITKSVILLGAQHGVDARTRGTTSESILNSSDGLQAFAIEADNVVIDGFTIQGVNANPNSIPLPPELSLPASG